MLGTLLPLLLLRAEDGVSIEPLDRYAFYERSEQAFAIVQYESAIPERCGAFALTHMDHCCRCVDERRPYGNVVLKKGVVGPDGKDLMP